MLAIVSVGNVLGAEAWAELSEDQGCDEIQLALSVVLAAVYAIGAAVIGFSPAVSRAVAAGRAARPSGGKSDRAEPGAEPERPAPS